MKLPQVVLDLIGALAEFDVWITPTLGEIKDTPRFREELESVAHVFDTMGEATEEFVDIRHCRPEAIADTFIDFISDDEVSEAQGRLQSLASVLFLVTGKSDNNAKCQLPIFLRQRAGWKSMPTSKRGKLTQIEIPRVLKAEQYMTFVAGLGQHHDAQKRLLEQFVSFVLSDESYISQLWSIGRSYCTLKAFGKERDLLSPLVVFQVRGSVSASGGHDPEMLLRARLEEWGLLRDVDFNSTDVVLSSLGVGGSSEATPDGARFKSRAYDFVIPFKTPGWTPKIFVQSQFYAGDSGSVSHKNVDQTSTSRTAALKQFKDARFVEYVDGAGYFSSLNGDLKTLLSMPTTASFTQVRSGSIRLRREIQQIGFVTLLEIEHAILRSDSSVGAVQSILRSDGYQQKEIDRALKSASDLQKVKSLGNNLQILDERRPIARRYLLLDTAALYGKAPTSTSERITGSLMVPGFGPFHAIKLDALVSEALKMAPALKSDWSNPEEVMGDIRWLCDQGLAMSC